MTQKYPFEFEINISISITDLDYRYMLKKELKEIIEIIPKDKGKNSVKNFLEQIRLLL
ncbi:hypothetical protein NEF87_004905 [Candidatus Lokiarchaeum ossiferum]|uniref:Uncharacterized protein n=1 Tax=Candidatus Lokiarchaeum ossiferum TaxID=2951803 RepID=A0ABY6HYX5_9ARCH|nr:hypothetical protein NEF87_004905 [Candidatus Lokiarchaeum sp. B-35]